MTQPRTRWRRLAAVTASALLGLTAGATPLSPAAAEEQAALRGSFFFPAISVGAGPDSAGKTGKLQLSVEGDVAARQVTATFDSSTLKKLTVSPPGAEHGCTTAGTITTCTRAEVKPGEDVKIPFVFRVAAGAEVGDTDEVHIEIRAENIAGSFSPGGSVTIVGSGVDLVAQHERFKNVVPGSTIDLKPTVVNSGDTAADGMVLEFTSNSRYLSYTSEYQNCVVGEWGPVCLFPDVSLEPGKTYQLVEPLRFAVSTRIPWPVGASSAYAIWPGDGSRAAAARKAIAGRQGGKRLALVERTSTPRSLSDVVSSDNHGFFAVQTTRNPADLSVDAVELSGKVGDSLTFRATMTNNGPADTGSRADYDPGSLYVNAPGGTVFSDVDRDCLPIINGRLDPSKMGQGGYRTYKCLLASAQAGTSPAFPFTLKITSKTVGSDGWLEAREGYVPDDDPKNNKAALVVTVEGGGTPSASPSAPGGGGGFGDGGPLPKTGVSLPMYGVVAALLIGVGGVLYLVARRRRTAAEVTLAD